MKEEYCLKNNIPLLQLNYSKGFCGTDFTNWDKIIESFYWRKINEL